MEDRPTLRCLMALTRADGSFRVFDRPVPLAVAWAFKQQGYPVQLLADPADEVALATYERRARVGLS